MSGRTALGAARAIQPRSTDLTPHYRLAQLGVPQFPHSGPSHVLAQLLPDRARWFLILRIPLQGYEAVLDIEPNDRLALIAIVRLPFLVHGSGSRLIGGHEVGVETPEVQSGLDSILGYTSQFRDPEGASILELEMRREGQVRDRYRGVSLVRGVNSVHERRSYIPFRGCKGGLPLKRRVFHDEIRGLTRKVTRSSDRACLMCCGNSCPPASTNVEVASIHVGLAFIVANDCTRVNLTRHPPRSDDVKHIRQPIMDSAP